LQQRSPAFPQTTQVPLAQVVVGAVQVLEEQQGCPRPPQLPQLPEAQAEPFAQVVPCEMQVAALQQPPAMQPLPMQHGSPGAPQDRQMFPWQMLFGLAQTLPAQQVSPGPPQVPQIPDRQEAPASLQRFPSQQGSPFLPQATQSEPGPQARSGETHLGVVPQQGSSRWPHRFASPLASSPTGRSRTASEADGRSFWPSSVRRSFPPPSFGRMLVSEQPRPSTSVRHTATPRHAVSSRTSKPMIHD
jgi:hypothetical protein